MITDTSAFQSLQQCKMSCSAQESKQQACQTAQALEVRFGQLVPVSCAIVGDSNVAVQKIPQQPALKLGFQKGTGPHRCSTGLG